MLNIILIFTSNIPVRPNVKDRKRSEACLHSVYNYVGLSRVYGLWGFNPVPVYIL